MASFALRAGALYWAPNYISKFSFLDNINNQWLKLTKNLTAGSISEEGL